MSNAMRGVFVSSLKLAAFHAGFTWLTLKVSHSLRCDEMSSHAQGLNEMKRNEWEN
jgi:hypothetical protein